MGFEKIRTTARLRAYDGGNGGGVRPNDWEVAKEGREDYIKAMDVELGPWLGPACCTSIGDGSGNSFESMLFMDFHPRQQ